MPLPAKKLGISLISLVVASVLAWTLLEVLDQRGEGSSVKVVDNSEEVSALLESRTREEEAPPAAATDGYPPPLVREPLPLEVAEKMFSALRRKDIVHEPGMILRRASHIDLWQKFREHPAGGWQVRTNALGMREDEEVRAEPPDLRIIVTGDSHTHGMCANEESFTNVLEALLREERADRTVEALNTGTGAFSFYNYLGTLERYRELEPDVFICVVYGGNDFSGMQRLYRYFNHQPPAKNGPLERDQIVPRLWKWGGIEAQEVLQVVYFLNNPDAEATSSAVAASVALEMQRIAEESGIELLFVYLPPPFRGQPQQLADEVEEALAAIDLELDDLAVSDRLADDWLAFLEERGMAYVDLRPLFKQAESCYYWRTDHHINLDGHRAIARRLSAAVAEILE